MNDSIEIKRGYEFESGEEKIYGKRWKEKKEGRSNVIILYFQKYFKICWPVANNSRFFSSDLQ